MGYSSEKTREMQSGSSLEVGGILPVRPPSPGGHEMETGAPPAPYDEDFQEEEEGHNEPIILGDLSLKSSVRARPSQAVLVWDIRKKKKVEPKQPESKGPLASYVLQQIKLGAKGM